MYSLRPLCQCLSHEPYADQLEQNTRIGNIDALKKYNLLSCMECGCCSFVCPASRPLVQSMRVGKALLRNASGR